LLEPRIPRGDLPLGKDLPPPFLRAKPASQRGRWPRRAP